MRSRQHERDNCSVILFALAHAAEHSPGWQGSDLASLMCTCTGAAAQLSAVPGHTAVRVVLKSQQHAENFIRWLDNHGSLCSGLELELEKAWWAEWAELELDPPWSPEWVGLECDGGIVSYGRGHDAAALALTKTLQAGHLSRLKSFTCCHVFPTEGLLQVLPTGLTQLCLSYQTNTHSKDPESMWLSDDEGELVQFDGPDDSSSWPDWVTPLIDGLGRLTGLRSLTLDVDINCHDDDYASLKFADNSAILCAVSPLTRLTELRLPNSRCQDLHPTPDSVLQLPASLQSLEVYESRTQRSQGQSLHASLSHLTSLTKIDLGDCYIFGPRGEGEPPTLPPSVRHIGCNFREGGGCNMAVLQALPALEHLESGYCLDSLVGLAAGLSHLTHVELSYCLEDYCREQEHRSFGTFGLSAAVASLEAAGLADAVRKVHLGSDSCIFVGPQVLQQLARLPNLSALHLSTFQFSGDGLSALTCLAALTALDCNDYGWTKEQLLQQLPAVVDKLPSLRVLFVLNSYSLNNEISAEERHALRSRLEGIPHLTCVGCSW